MQGNTEASAQCAQATTPANDDSFVQSFDAQVWAKAFAKIFPRVYREDGEEIAPRPEVESLMVGWFANALMRGHDQAMHERAEREQSFSSIALDLLGPRMFMAIDPASDSVDAMAFAVTYLDHEARAPFMKVPRIKPYAEAKLEEQVTKQPKTIGTLQQIIGTLQQIIANGSVTEIAAENHNVAAYIKQLEDRVAKAEAGAQVARDMHTALGVEWGKNPYEMISRLQNDSRTLHEAPSGTIEKINPLVKGYNAHIERRLEEVQDELRDVDAALGNVSAFDGLKTWGEKISKAMRAAKEGDDAQRELRDTNAMLGVHPGAGRMARINVIHMLLQRSPR